MIEILQPLLGIAALLALAWGLSEERRHVSWRLIVGGVAAQFLVAFALVGLPASQQIFIVLNDGVAALLRATEAGTGFVFGYLGGGDLPFEEPYPGAAYIFAFRALPLVLLIGPLSALLYHWRVLPWVVRGFAWALGKALHISGPAGFATAANIFVGNVEASLLIRPYLMKLTRCELFITMSAGLATIAGTVLILYATILNDVVPGAIGHMVTASVISAPAVVLVSMLMIPPSGKETVGAVESPKMYDSAVAALTQGSLAGLRLLGYIIALLVSMVALVALVNMILGSLPLPFAEPLTLERLLGWLLAPVMWLIGIPWGEANVAGQLFGTKVILNELVSFLQMAEMGDGTLSERSRIIMAYAMCGFANAAGVSILVGGLGALVPERTGEIGGLALKSLVAGNIATCMTGAVVAVVISVGGVSGATAG